MSASYWWDWSCYLKSWDLLTPQWNQWMPMGLNNTDSLYKQRFGDPINQTPLETDCVPFPGTRIQDKHDLFFVKCSLTFCLNTDTGNGNRKIPTTLFSLRGRRMFMIKEMLNPSSLYPVEQSEAIITTPEVLVVSQTQGWWWHFPSHTQMSQFLNSFQSSCCIQHCTPGVEPCSRACFSQPWLTFLWEQWKEGGKPPCC